MADDIKIELPLLKNAKFKSFSYERGLAVGYIIGVLSSQVDDPDGILGTLATTLGDELDGEENKIVEVLEEVHTANMNLFNEIANSMSEYINEKESNKDDSAGKSESI